MNYDQEQLWKEAVQFLQLYHRELELEDQLEARLQIVQCEIEKTGTYEHTYEELAYGAKVAWRNSNRCIGRLFWERMEVIDARLVTNSEEVFARLIEHIRYAGNDGKIKPLITIFAPVKDSYQPVKIWNHQLMRYAGYETEYGIVGDPASVTFTKQCQELGWRGEGTAFDLLPLVIQVNHGKPEWIEIPNNIVIEVPINHPTEDIFAGQDVKWYGVPIISDMRLEIGGLNYVAAPFNGWYMGTEIGARNLADENRYNLLPLVAEQLGLNTKHLNTLWKDRALVELNVAVLESFKQAGVSIVDHHTAAKQFEVFEKQEQKSGRTVTGNWAWLIPPLSPATTHVFHKPYDNTIQKPNYFYPPNKVL
ncbi:MULTISPECIES: nitric oxide synthase oxygenase [Clostridia]|uniref:nitric oxide synthase oxygenase n=1 Tax=Clostridia TaxID=186801 RepID=UPI000EA1BB37|nr:MULTISPECIES: nitric oxide synthase oxygenase [Clostridia]NBJ68240.1 nitric oxide synthase [Roseburia sp. 1XD42-34]RKI82006.1 nitric oxide synthase [Clostridium sp. 1xD42-85]